MFVHYTTRINFWLAKQQSHKLLKHSTKMLLQNIYTANLSLVRMMINMLKTLSKSSIFVRQRLNELEHTDLITEYIHNLYTAAYLES